MKWEASAQGRDGEPWLELHHLVSRGFRMLGLIEHNMGRGEQPEQSGVQLSGLVYDIYNLLIVAIAETGDAEQSQVPIGVKGIKTHRTLDTLNRLGRLTHIEMQITVIDQEIGVLRVKIEGSFECCLRAIEFRLSLQHFTQYPVGSIVSVVQANCLAGKLLGYP